MCVCKDQSPKIKQRKKHLEQIMAVKHCRAFQISVTHQKDLESTQPLTHTIKFQTDPKYKRCLFLENYEQKKLWYNLSHSHYFDDNFCASLCLIEMRSVNSIFHIHSLACSGAHHNHPHPSLHSLHV